MTRLQTGLTVSLVLLLVLLLLGVGERGAAQAVAARRPLLPEAALGQPVKLQIADADGNQLTLVRSGTRWTLAEFGDYPADADKVDDVLQNLAALEVRRPAVTLARYHESLRVAADAFECRVRLWPTADADPVELYMGTAPNFRITNARRAESDEVFAVTDLASYEYAALPERWTPDMWPEDFFAEATWMKLENAQATLIFDKVGGGIWMPGDDGGPIDHAKVDNFLRTANGLWIRKPLGPVAPEHGFDAPLARLTMKIGDPPERDEDGNLADDTRREVVVLIGAKLEGEEELYTMGRPDFGFAASVRGSSVKRLLEDGRAAFVPDMPEELPTPPVAEPAPEAPAEPDDDGS